MKNVFLITAAALLFWSNSALAQDAFEVQTRVYKNAMKNYDLQAANIALYNMIALKPERADLLDSLARIYFIGEKYYQAYTIGEEILKTNPKRTDILELVAIAKQSLGMTKEALADYEKLYDIEKTLPNLYQIAAMQYQLKRYGECVASVDQIINDLKSTDEKVTISLQKGSSQEVPVKAAAYNVKGICALEMNQNDVARDNFTKALDVFPDFMLAKGNLELMNKKEAQPKQPAAPATPAAKTPAPGGKITPGKTPTTPAKAPAKPQGH